MERSLLVRVNFATILFFIVLGQQQAGAADRSVSLIMGDECEMETISQLDVRKAYLGVAVTFAGRHVQAMRIRGDDKLDQIFYQSVVAMSERTYAIRLLRLLMKYGQPRPMEFRSADELFTELVVNLCSIGYAWTSDIKERVDIKVIRVLWQEN